MIGACVSREIGVALEPRTPVSLSRINEFYPASEGGIAYIQMCIEGTHDDPHMPRGGGIRFMHEYSRLLKYIVAGSDLIPAADHTFLSCCGAASQKHRNHFVNTDYARTRNAAT